MVWSQIANLTPSLYFGHNLCFKCSNGSYDPILNIYVPRSFQWYKELFNSMGFDLYNHFMKIWESIRTSTPQSGNSLGNVGVHPLTLSHTPGSMKCDSLPSHVAYTFASPCLGCEPKVKVTTFRLIMCILQYNKHIFSLNQ